MNDDLELIDVFRSRIYGVKGDRITEKIKREGRHEWAETSLIPQFLTDGACAYDVGANIGYYTSLFSLWVGSAGSVHAFEANPMTADILEKSIELNGWKNVHLNRMAVSETRGEVRVAHSGLEGKSGGNLGGWKLKETNTGDVVIPTIALDEYMATSVTRRPSFVKVDVEGFEKNVIRGARQVLRCGAVFMVEFVAADPETFDNCQEVAREFRTAGYTLAAIKKKPAPHLTRVQQELDHSPFHHNIFCLPPTYEVLCR